MKKSIRRILARRKRNLARRLNRKAAAYSDRPVLSTNPMRYEMAGRVQAMACGGVGAIHAMAVKLGLPRALDAALRLLKVHAPYHESDHVLNLAYNILAGGECIEDLERLRNDEAYMNALGASRIPDPTTAGDFLRRFDEGSIRALMAALNAVRAKVWERRGAADERFVERAVLDVDGTIAPTLGECKQGMDMSYKGVWGYAPLIVSLANTREPLFLVNRPGNTPSSKGAAPWIDQAIELVRGTFKEVLVRGDTDFGLSEHLDRWDEQVKFIFGWDARLELIEMAEYLPRTAWRPLRRAPKYTVRTRERTRPANVKEAIVRARGYENQRLVSEEVAEMDYRPHKCAKSYRLIILRKNLSVERGETVLFPDVRYFFYITNVREASREEIVRSANQRCDQENVIAQLKHGINAMRMPAGDLAANWAYMVIAALAWTLKAWYGLMVPDERAGAAVVRMEFKRFLHTFMLIPCQIVRTARRRIARVLRYAPGLETFFATLDAIGRLTPT